jgi:CheY-like chemotaxis protein
MPMTKILAVDDESSFVEMIKSYFEPRGYDVLIAHDGAQALGIAEAEQPDIALIDLKMPGIKGDEVMNRLKSISPYTKCLMVTASEGEGRIAEKMLKLGAYACFDKPLTSLKHLEFKIKEVLKKK